MTRTIYEILRNCKEGGEIMSLDDFMLCIKTVGQHIKRACEFPDGSIMSKQHFKFADELCFAIEDCFSDRSSNLVKWFRGMPCEIGHSLSGETIKIKVRDDIETIYFFLRYCMLINLQKPIEREVFNRFASLLCAYEDD